MTSDDKFRDAAMAIAGADPPPWLVKVVRLGAIVIRGNTTTRAEFPVRKVMRERLDNLRTAAQVLAREFNGDYYRDLDSYAAVAYLIDAGLDLATVNALAHAVPKLAACAKLVRPIRGGSGRDKAFPNSNFLTPHEMCAGVTAYGWYHTRGKLPPHTSKEAQKACEAMWAATGLSRARAGAPESLTGWRPHLATIKRNLDRASPPDSSGRSFREFWDGLHEIAGQLPNRLQVK